MSTHPLSEPTPKAMIWPFPTPGLRVQLAYQALYLAVNGTAEERLKYGSPTRLPRPWEPATCLDPGLRLQVWQWLDGVVEWLNHEYSWDTATIIPSCWPQHPHLVHELAAVADQRRRAGLDTTSNILEDWHRNTLPEFHDRLRTRLRSHCEDGHNAWPGRSQHAQHARSDEVTRRSHSFQGDIADLLDTDPDEQGDHPSQVRSLSVVDRATGEIRHEFGDED